MGALHVIRISGATHPIRTKRPVVFAPSFVLGLIVVNYIGGVWTEGVRKDISRVAEGYAGAVATDEKRCSTIGVATLRNGGNAVDSAVASVLCLGVINSMASGIGGGSFLLLRLANGTAKAYDMREVAPGRASQTLYAGNSQLQIEGPLSIAVPGEIAGLYLVWQHHGRLPWASLFQPAIKLATKGFVVHPYLAYQINETAKEILADKGLRETFAPGGTLLKAGDICYRKALAKTLQILANEGPDAFYNGTIGDQIVEDVQRAGGILSTKDLRDYRVKIREPVVAHILGSTVLGMPPPSSGGACLILILNILAAYKVPSLAVMGSLGLHRIIEAFKHAYAVRMNLSDPDFVNVTGALADMLSPAYASDLQKKIFDNRTFAPSYYGDRLNQVNDHGTSQLCIVDSERNAISMTTTINYPFGSKFVSLSTGIVLNNEMGDFSLPSDDLPVEKNFIAPGKRPLSSMAPTIILKDGQLYAVLGGSGGIRIITATTQVYINRVLKGLNPLSSVIHPRVHHQVSSLFTCTCTHITHTLVCMLANLARGLLL
eukprot:c21165_g1_i2 orf=285-1919(+)